MPFFRITHNPAYDFATVYNYGCNFRCPFCSYKLRSGPGGTPGLRYPEPAAFLALEEVFATLKRLRPGVVGVMGGEPTLNPDLPRVLRFAKRELGARTRLGHTNGSGLPLGDLDAANVGFKAFSPELHRRLTGRDREVVYGAFSRAFDAGIELSANMIYIPGLVEDGEFEELARFLAGHSQAIPFHVMGYIPVPGAPWRRPETEEMTRVTELCRRYLHRVESSHLSSREALDLTCRDDRFKVGLAAGV